MPEIQVQFSEADIARIDRMLAGIKGGTKKAIGLAVRDTTKTSEAAIAKKIAAEVAIKLKDIKKYVSSRRTSPTSAAITLSKSKRIPLKYFGARQTRKGVSYRIDKSGSRKVALHAFGPKIAKLSHHVFVRGEKQGLVAAVKKLFTGRATEKLVPLKGPSPWGVFVKSGMIADTKVDAANGLLKAVEGRVRFLILKHRGQI